MLHAVLAIAFLSVRLSLICRYYVQTNERRTMPYSQLDSTEYLIFGNIRFISIFAMDRP